MGIIRQGILGGFRKKTGNVVGASWRTLDVIRGLPKNSGKAPTKLQKDQRTKFALITSFLSNIGDLVEVGYKSLSKISTPMNVAVSQNFHAAITGISPDFALDYTKLKFSTGKLDMPSDVEGASAAGAKVKFTWGHTDPDGKFLDTTDMATVLAYNAVKHKFVRVIDAAPRSAGLFNLQLPVSFANDQVHCYISFNSKLKKNLVSVSEYVGAITVLA